MTPDASKPHVCPWWLGYFLITPLRRLVDDPSKILRPYVREGMTVLEIGPGMGYFSLPLARYVDRQGMVVCVDIQDKMLRKLRARADKAGLGERIVTVHATQDSLCIETYAGKADFALAYAVVHEVPNHEALFRQIHSTLKAGGLLLVAEPRGHVTEEQFQNTMAIAQHAGFGVEKRLDIPRSHSALLKK